MLKFAAISIAALTASAAFAQAPTSVAPAPAPASPSAATPSTATPSTGTSAAPVEAAPAQPGATTATDPSTTAQAAPSGNANAQVVAVIEAGFPKYDADKDGKLSDAEFKQWIADLKTQEMAAQGKPADSGTVNQYASAALGAADKNKDNVVTKDELTSFLGG